MTKTSNKCVNPLWLAWYQCTGSNYCCVFFQQDHGCGRHWSCQVVSTFLQLSAELSIHLAQGSGLVLLFVLPFAARETLQPSCRVHRFAGRWKTWSTTTRRPRSRSERPPPTTHGDPLPPSWLKLQTWPTTWWPSPKSWEWFWRGWTITAKTGATFTKRSRY